MIHERLGGATLQVLTNTPSDGDIGTSVDHKKGVSVDGIEGKPSTLPDYMYHPVEVTGRGAAFMYPAFPRKPLDLPNDERQLS